MSQGGAVDIGGIAAPNPCEDPRPSGT